MYVVRRTEKNDLRTQFGIIGEKSKLYNVSISHLVQCDCPVRTWTPNKDDLAPCKHVIYIVRYVLKAPRELWRQIALKSKELVALLGVTPTGNGHNCPICIVKYDGSNETTTCKTCNQPIHGACLEMWFKYQDKPTCPLCRAEWNFGEEVACSGDLLPLVKGDDGYQTVPGHIKPETHLCAACGNYGHCERDCCPEESESGTVATRFPQNASSKVASTRRAPRKQRATASVDRAWAASSTAEIPRAATSAASTHRASPVENMQEAQSACGTLVLGVYLRSMDIKWQKQSIEDALSCFGNNPFSCEYKYDGWRVQIHFEESWETAKVFSHGGLDWTCEYPDIAEELSSWRKQETRSCVLDCEMVPWDGEKHRPLPRLDLSTRKKGPVRRAEVDVKVHVFAFDLLYHNGEPLIDKSLSIRRERLRDSFEEKPGEFSFAQSSDEMDFISVKALFDRSVEKFGEGIVMKKLNGVYLPDRKSEDWLKVKQHYSLDLVVIGATEGGATKGRGKNVGKYVSFLLACYNNQSGKYEAISKIRKHIEIAQFDKEYPLIQRGSSSKKSYVLPPDSKVDVWFQPSVVWEVSVDGFGESSKYQAASAASPSKGVSLKSAKFVCHREDKEPTNATMSWQIAGMLAKTPSGRG